MRIPRHAIILNANSLLVRSQLLRIRSATATTTSPSTILTTAASAALSHRWLLSTRRHVLDFWDPLEPLEMMWEFYCKRYEILDELLGKVAAFTKRNSVKVVCVVAGLYVSAELLARVGVFGKRGEGLFQTIFQSDRIQEGVEERVLQKMSTFMLDKSMDSLRLLRRFGGKSKFAISLSVGAFFGKGVIQLTTFLVRSVMITFFVLETLSFLGVIGEQGETILDWIDDQRDSSAEWVKRFARFHKGARKRMNMEFLESFYEAAVDEEKIAAFGFSLGTVIGLLT